MNAATLVLASNSPRRRYLLTAGGWDYRTHSVDISETPLNGEPAAHYVRRLAEDKARAAARTGAAGLVLAADTSVVDRDGLLGKPASVEEARQMLLRLRGQTHQVFTSLAVLDTSNGQMLTDLCITDVPMRAYCEAEIDAYIQSGDPLDKAGAYAIQHTGFHPVERLAGCYANVVGLPLCHLTRTLRAMGAAAPENVPQACQAALGYACPVYEQILAQKEAYD
jgi:MAF protein